MGQLTVHIKPEVKAKLDLYIALCKYEISGLGTVRKLDSSNLLIEDIYLLEQEVTAGSTDLDEGAVSKLMVECLDAGIDSGDIKFWFHSHADMKVFWSGTDDSTINSFGNDYFISIVGNRKGKYKTRVDVYDPIRVTLDDLPLELYCEEADNELIQEISKEIDDKVTFKPTIVSYTGSRGGKRGRGREKATKEVEYLDYSGFSLPCNTCETNHDCQNCDEVELIGST